MKRIVLIILLVAGSVSAQLPYPTIPNSTGAAAGAEFRARVNANFSWLNTNKASTSATLTLNGVTITLGTANSITSTNITEGTNLYFTNARTLSAMAGLYESPLTFSAPLSRSVNTISLTACADGEIHKYRTATGWTCEADQTGAAGGGITTLNTLNGASQTFSRSNDTNVTLTLTPSGTDHNFALGWTGTLAIARGGTGAATTLQNYVFAGPTSGSGAPSFRILDAGDIPNLSATYAPVGHNHTGTYEPADATILKQVNLAGSGAATTPARSDHNHTGTYAASNATATVNGTTVTLGASATITANLPANPTACTAGQYVTDIAADGTLTCSAPGGSGTVTVVASGALASTALVTGGGTTTLQTPAATATMDGSGNISTPGKLTADSFESSDTTHSGAELMQGVTSGGLAWAVADVAGTLTTLLYPTDSSTATTGKVLAIGDVTTCPTLPAGMPATCRATSWATVSGAATNGTNGQILTSNGSGGFGTPAAYGTVVGLFGGGTCSGYLKSDGTCSTGSSAPAGWVSAPAAPDSTGTQGQYSGDATYAYLAIATDSWKRVAWDAGWLATVATPTFSPVAGAVANPTTVTISSTTPSAVICHTEGNGSQAAPTATTPGTCATGTTGATVSVTSATTIKALATKAGMANSADASAAYTISAGGDQASDTFTGTASTNLTAHTSGSGHSWTAQGTSAMTLDGSGSVQGVANSSNTYIGEYFSSLTPSAANYKVCTTIATDGVEAAYAIGRATGEQNFYYAGYSGAGLVVSKMVAGSPTVLGSTTGSGYNQEICLVMSGSSISATADGVEIIAPVTDSAFSAAGSAGIGLRIGAKASNWRVQ